MRWTLETLLWYKVKLTRHRGTWWLPHRLGGQSRTHHTYKQNRPAPYQSKTHLTLTTAGEAWPPPPPPTLSSPPPCLTFLPTKETSTRGHTERSSLCNTRVVKPCFVAAAVLCNFFVFKPNPLQHARLRDVGGVEGGLTGRRGVKPIRGSGGGGNCYVRSNKRRRGRYELKTTFGER